jgi:hypothetical protein
VVLHCFLPPRKLFLIPEPENCIFEQLVLCRVGINLSSITHIHVDHSILGGTRLLRADGAELLPKREPLLRIRQVIYSTKGVVILCVLAYIVLIVSTS